VICHTQSNILAWVICHAQKRLAWVICHTQKRLAWVICHTQKITCLGCFVMHKKELAFVIFNLHKHTTD
jgi:hypothetical protein